MPVETSFNLGASRIRDRFTRENLHALLDAIGPGAVTEARILDVPRFALLEDRIRDRGWRERVEAAGCTIDEADDPALRFVTAGMSYVPHMRTHASSVVAAFERAIEINPSLEPMLRQHLRDARRTQTP